MADTTRAVVRDEVVKTRVVVSVGPVDRDAFGTFGWFLGIRNRNNDPRLDTRDRGRYGTCVICRQKFGDGDEVHMVGNVVRNGKPVGNRFCCRPCADTHGTFRSSERGDGS